MAQNRNLFRLTRFILLKLPYLFRFLARFRKPAKRLLIIKADAIGDYILFRNFIEEVKRSAKYRNYEVDLLGNTLWQDVALAYDSPFVAKFFFTRALQLYYKPAEVFKLGWQLFCRNYEVVLNPSSTRVFITDGLAALCAAKQTIGYQSNTEGIEEKYKRKTDKFYSRSLILPNAAYHEFQRNKFFFEEVLGESISLESTSLPAGPATKAGIMIFPGAGLAARGWEADKFIGLIKLIRQNTPQAIYVAGGPGETAMNNYISEMADSNVINLTGQTPLANVVAKIASSALVIGNDSSPIHIATALRTPSVCITGGGHFNRFVPYPPNFAGAPVCVYHQMDCYYCNWNCKYQIAPGESFPCLSNITVEAVWRAVKPLL